MHVKNPSPPTTVRPQRTLKLTGNKLEGLSDTIGDCQTLEVIDLSGNNIDAVSLPSALWTLPKLRSVDLSGNPPTQRESALFAGIPDSITVVL
jgi:Leucine-rich repeat (LRR) protein